MLLWLRILESARETGRYRRLFWLPAVMLIWVNLHGGFLLGFVLLAIYWCDTKWVDSEDARLGHSNGERMLSYVTLASAFTSLINPFGYRIYTHIYQYLGDSFLMNHIQEFQSPNFHAHQQSHREASLRRIHSHLPVDLEALANHIRQVVQDLREVATRLALNHHSRHEEFYVDDR